MREGRREGGKEGKNERGRVRMREGGRGRERCRRGAKSKNCETKREAAMGER